MDEPQFAEFIHEKIHAAARRPHHLPSVSCGIIATVGCGVPSRPYCASSSSARASTQLGTVLVSVKELK
jgi:hypothetical protein